MGPSASDFYQKQDLASAQPRKDQHDSEYIWLDLRINGQENKIYLDKFRGEFKVGGEGKVESFKEFVKSYNTSRSKLRVICAASLPEDVYGFIQNNENIERALLFCGNKIRAANLMRDYSKIAKACYNYNQVIKQVKIWQKQPFTSFHFYEPQEIQKLNKFNANLMSLTDSKNIVIKESQDQMLTYLKQFLPNDIPLVDRFINDLTKARATPESMSIFIKDSLQTVYSKIFNEINYLLKVTSNPKKLAFFRCIISNLFACLSDSYFKLQLPQSTFYTVLQINQSQAKRILRQEQYFINSFFLSAETMAPSEFLELKDHQIKLYIKTPFKQAKSALSNGYLYYSKKVMFNPGCYFELESYDEASRTLTVKLMHLVPQLQKGREKQQGIYLNYKWLTKLQSKYDGQWLALLFSDSASAQSYINQKIDAIINEKDKRICEEYKFKWLLYREQWNFQTNKLSNIESALEIIKPYDDASIVQLALMHCDLFWILKKQNRLKASIKAVMPYLNKNISKSLILKIRIYQVCDKILDIGNFNSLKSLLQELNKIEQSLQKEQCYELSPVYFLLLTVKIRCLSELGSFSQELGMVDKMMKVHQICAGRSSPQCIRLNRLKVVINSLKNREVNDKEAIRKAKLLSKCKVKMDDLRDPIIDCAYPVNCSKLNLELYS